MKSKILSILMLLIGIPSWSQSLPEVVSGKIERLENFQSKYIEARNVDIWLPKEYNTQEKYAVLYMHDGQMLFDSNTTWNHQAWDVDDIATQLMKKGKVQNFIVVGIWNGGKARHSDYFPQKPFESLTQQQKETIRKELQNIGGTNNKFHPESDNYLKFLVYELKPYIDKKYSVYSDQRHTFIAGSSMGGLISMYAICEYPGIFGGAACLSTHWPGTFTVENNPIPDAFLHYLDKNLDKIRKNKIYFDYGNQTLDALYPPLQKKVDELFRKHGFTSKNWETKFFRDKNHSENSWKERFHIPLLFLLKPSLNKENNLNEKKDYITKITDTMVELSYSVI